MATAAIARGEATRTRKADNNKFVNSLSIHHEKIQGSDVLGIREIHMVLQLPADAADPAGGAAAPDHQEPDPEGDEQVTSVDHDKVVEESWQQALIFENFAQDQMAQKVKEDQEKAEQVFQLGLMGLGITNCPWAWACGHGHRTTAGARGLAAMGSGGSSSSGSAAMATASSSTVAGRQAWHEFPATQLQRDIIKNLCQEMGVPQMIPDDRGHASDAMVMLVAMKRARKSG